VPDFEHALASAIRRAREREGRIQEDLAAQARKWGLEWTSATVAAIETARRHVSAVELLLLPLVLASDEGPAELADLLADLGDEVALTPEASTSGQALALIARGQLRDSLASDSWDVPIYRIVDAAIEAVAVWVDRYMSRYPKLQPSDLIKADGEASGEAERKAGYRLGASPLDVAIAARSLWGRSLSDERDARAKPGASPQARGRITRQLFDELKPVLKEGGRRGSRRTSR
jgi:hypothetical protein